MPTLRARARGYPDDGGQPDRRGHPCAAAAGCRGGGGRAGHGFGVVISARAVAAAAVAEGAPTRSGADLDVPRGSVGWFGRAYHRDSRRVGNQAGRH